MSKQGADLSNSILNIADNPRYWELPIQYLAHNLPGVSGALHTDKNNQWVELQFDSNGKTFNAGKNFINRNLHWITSKCIFLPLRREDGSCQELLQRYCNTRELRREPITEKNRKELSRGERELSAGLAQPGLTGEEPLGPPHPAPRRPEQGSGAGARRERDRSPRPAQRRRGTAATKMKCAS